MRRGFILRSLSAVIAPVSGGFTPMQVASNPPGLAPSLGLAGLGCRHVCRGKGRTGHLQQHVFHSQLQQAQCLNRRAAYVNHIARPVRSAVVDAYIDLSAGAQAAHPHHRAKGQGFVGRRHGMHIKALAAGGAAALKARAVPRRPATLQFPQGLRRGRGWLAGHLWWRRLGRSSRRFHWKCGTAGRRLGGQGGLRNHRRCVDPVWRAGRHSG